MKRLAHGLVLAPLFVLGLTTATLAQPLPVTPTPTLISPEACPAKIRFSWDITSIAGADRIQWQILRGAPGSDLAGAISVSTNDRLGAIGSLDKDLRQFGPVLDGTRYFVRVRAQRAGSGPIAEFSEPVIFQRDELPDGMASAEALPAAEGVGIRISWNLTGGIGACANRIVYRIDKTDGSASVGGAAAGVSDTTAADLSPYGPGVYDVIVRAAHNGVTPDDGVGREDVPIRVIVAPSGLEPVALRVDVRDGLSTECATGTPATFPGAIVRVVGNTPGPGGILFDEARHAEASGRATFTVPPQITYTVTTSPSTCEGTASASVSPTADTTVSLTLAGCHDPRADVRTALSAPGSATAGVPFSLTVTLTHGGGAGPSRAGTLVVERRNPDASGRVVLDTRGVSAFCPSQVRSLTITDPSPPAGPMMYGAVATLTDVDQTNNVDSQSVVFAAAPPPVLVIDAFSLQGGASSVLVSTPVTLDATIRGTPSRFKAEICGPTFNAATFRLWPAAPPPVLPGFTTAGTRIVCFLVQNPTLSSAIVRDTIQVVTLLVVQPALPVASPPLSLPIRVSSFQIRGGAQFVTVGRQVPLNVTVTGGPTEFPTEFRAVTTTSSACESALDSQPFQPFSLSARTRTFGSPGRRFVCIQLRRGWATSNVAKDDIQVVLTSVPSSTMGLTLALSSAAGPTTFRNQDCVSQIAIGVTVFAGDLVDSIGLRCASLGINGEHSNFTIFPQFGGDGGGERGPIMECPSGQVLYGFQGRFGDFIDQISILCIPWRRDIGSNGAFNVEQTEGGAGGQAFGPVVCPGPLAVKFLEISKRSVTFVGTFVATLRFTCVAPPDM